MDKRSIKVIDPETGKTGMLDVFSKLKEGFVVFHLDDGSVEEFKWSKVKSQGRKPKYDLLTFETKYTKRT